MAKKEKPAKKTEIKVPNQPKKHHNFPKFLFLFGVALSAVAVIDYFQWFSFPRVFLDIALLIAGVWIMFLALARGSYKHRKEVLKKYI